MDYMSSVIFSCYYLIVPAPNVNVRVLDDKPIIGESLSLECNVTVARGVTSSVNITWMVNGTNVTEAEITDNTDSKLPDNRTQYRVYYNITQLELSDDNTRYSCEAVINNTQKKNSKSVTVNNVTLSKYFKYLKQ